MNILEFLKKLLRNWVPSNKKPINNNQNRSEILDYQIGSRIGGDFLIKDVFGGVQKSGMGVVYLVENRKLDQPFVLKTYQQARLKTDFAQQFKAEAETWISVGSHPNIVKALWVDYIDFRLYVAAEYIKKDVEGRNSIRDFISYGALNPFLVLTLAAHFCYGMKYAQSKGLKAHRDIKPENLMIDDYLSLKITDFGLASLLHMKGSISGGTLPYMAPEQFTASNIVDHRADIYAFGIIIYEMVTGGGYPYPISIKSKKIEVDFFLAHTKLNPQKINSPFFPLIERCLSKEPKDRYQNYDQFLADIKLIAVGMGYKIPKERRRSAEDESEELYIRAQSFNNLGRREEALELIDQYIQSNLEDDRGWLERGKILLESNRLLEAEKSILRSLEIYNISSSAWNNLGILYGRQKKYEEAIVALHRSLEFDTCNSGALMNLALMNFQAKKYTNSAEVYCRAICKFPKKEALLFNAGNVAALMLKEGFSKEAILILNELSKAKPREINYWHNLALAYWHVKNIDKTIHCFKRVIEMNPSDEFARSSLIKLNNQKGEQTNT